MIDFVSSFARDPDDVAEAEWRGQRLRLLSNRAVDCSRDDGKSENEEVEAFHVNHRIDRFLIPVSLRVRTGSAPVRTCPYTYRATAARPLCISAAAVASLAASRATPASRSWCTAACAIRVPR